MSTVTEIREAIRKLPPQDAWKLAEELRDYLDALWDKQFEEDVKAERLDNLIARGSRGARHWQNPADGWHPSRRVNFGSSIESCQSQLNERRAHIPALEGEPAGIGTAL